MERQLKRQPSKPTLKRPDGKPAIESTMERSADMQKVDMMTGSYVQSLMNAATSFHKLHLQVTGVGSYAQHKALNEIYDALPDLADGIAEGYQGACEVILDYPEEAFYLNYLK